MGVVAVTTASAVAAGWAPRSDAAIVQLRVLDVGSTNTPLYGMPSTLSETIGAQTHHLGPAQFWLLAAPLRLVSALTNSAASLLIAAAIVSAIAIVAIAWAIGQANLTTRDVALTTAFVSLAIALGGPARTFSPWNPDFAFVMLTVAAVVAVISIVRRTTITSLLITVVAASAAAQAHMSYVGPAMILVGAVAVVAVVDASPADARRNIIWVTVGVVIVWAGPLLDALTNGGGNLRAVLTAEPADGAGWSVAFDRFANSVVPWQFGLRRPVDGTWFGQRASWSTRVCGLGVILLMMSCGRGRGLRRLAVLASAMVAFTVVTTAVAPENLATVFTAHVQRAWIVPVMLVWAVPMISLLRWSSHRWRRPLHGVPPRAIVAIAPVTLLLAALTVDRDQSQMVEPECSAAVVELATAAVDAMDGDIRVYDSSEVGLATFGFRSQVSVGIYAEIERRGGGTVVIGDFDRGMVSDHRMGLAGATDPSLRDQTVFVTGDAEPGADDHLLIATVSGPLHCRGDGDEGDDTIVLSLWRTQPTRE